MRKTTVKEVVSERLGERYYEISHKSGLTAFVFPKSFSTCYAVIGVRFGAIDRKFTDEKGNEVELPAGTAHFLEHKLFENPDKTNSDTAFAALGADDNAYTTYSTTRYLFSTTENEYECLSELLKMVTRPYFTKKTVKKEQGIIVREIAMCDDSPWSCGNENLLAGLYKESYLRDAICGTAKSVSEITDKVLYSAYENFYTLDNMALSVCGNVTPEKVVRVLDRELEKIPCKPAAKSIAPVEPKEIGCAKIEKQMKISRPIFFFGIKDSVDMLDDVEKARRRCGMSLLCNMLFSSSGEFYNRLLTEKLISPSLSFGYTMTRDCAYTVVSGESDDPERVAELIREKINKTHREGLCDEDLERCRRVFAAGYIRLFDSSEEIADDVLMNAWFSRVSPFSMLETLDSVTLEYCEELLSSMAGEGSCLSLIKPL